ncbi:hypothetical protein Tco_0785914 [Tanacetum coccineum]
MSTPIVLKGMRDGFNVGNKSSSRVNTARVDEHWLTLSAYLLQKALDVTPEDSTHPFESPLASKIDITFTRRRVPSNWLMKIKFNRLLNLIWIMMSTIYNETTGKLPIVEVKGKASQDETTGPSVHPEDATSTKMVRETLSHADAESGGNLEKINSETDTEILNFGDEQENPPSSSENLSSMKNLEDNFTFGDQFINDKSQEDEPGKTTVETELESMVTIPIQQVSSSIPPLSTLVIDLSPSKPISGLESQFMAPDQSSSGPALHEMTTATNIAGLIPKPPSFAPFVPLTRNEWETLLQPLFDEYSRTQPNVVAPVSEVAAPIHVVSTSTPSSTFVDQEAPLLSTSQTSQESPSHVISQGKEEDDHDIEVAHMNNNSGNMNTIPEPSSEESSSQNVHSINQPPEHIYKWTKDHPIENIIGN